MPSRPILAAKIDEIRGDFFVKHATKSQPEKVERALYPLLGTPKIDGIRALRLNQTLLSRSFKEIPNSYVRNYLSANTPEGLDGELIVVDAPFYETESGIMSESGIPDFRYLVFDYCPTGLEGVGYEKRLALLSNVLTHRPDEVSIVPTTLIHDSEQLKEYEEACLKEGYEGVCLRTPTSRYKEGRGTLRDSTLLKLKRFEDGEAVVLGFQELQRNENTPTTSELGLLKRSRQSSGLRNGGVLGALLVRGVRNDIEFKIGTGFTEKQRDEFWQNRERLLGQLVTYKSQPYGKKEAPRIPVFKAFRSILDL
jgi:DNA ligase-1